jgi:hypothetical protein
MHSEVQLYWKKPRAKRKKGAKNVMAKSVEKL